MQINSIGYTNSVYRQNTTPNYKSKPAAKNVSFGMFSIGNTLAMLDKQHSDACRWAEMAKLHYKKIIPQRKVPKDGIWGVVGSKLNNMIISGEINSEKLTGYKIRHVYVNVPYKDKPYTHRTKVIRRTFTQDDGQIKYYQDLYPNGRLETEIVKRTPNGELISHDCWTEMIG